MKFRVRAMKTSDLEVIVEMEKRIFPDDPWSYAAFSDGLRFEHSSGCVAEADEDIDGNLGALYAEMRSRIIGYACYYSAGAETHLTNMAVPPELRRKKIARALMEALLAEASAKESEAIFLEVRESNTPARRLYEGYGFVELHNRKAYYSNPREDAIVYVRRLKKTDTITRA